MNFFQCLKNAGQTNRQLASKYEILMGTTSKAVDQYSCAVECLGLPSEQYKQLHRDAIHRSKFEGLSHYFATPLELNKLFDGKQLHGQKNTLL